MSSGKDDKIIRIREMKNRETTPRKGLRINNAILKKGVKNTRKNITIRMNKRGERGSPCFTLIEEEKKPTRLPLMRIEKKYSTQYLIRSGN